MPRTKSLNEKEGEVLVVDSIQKPPHVVTYTQAKKIIKKPLSDAQQASVQRLIEYNKLKREQKDKAKSEQLAQEKEIEKQELLNNKKEEIVVLPKRIYAKKPRVVYVSDSESEESEEVIIKKKPKQPTQVSQKIDVLASERGSNTTRVIDETHEAIKKIDHVLSQTKKYNIFG